MTVLIRHFHISHNAPYLSPKMLHNLCSFLLGITGVPRKIENNAYAKFGGGWGVGGGGVGTYKVHYGKRGSSVYWFTRFCSGWVNVCHKSMQCTNSQRIQLA